MEGKDNNKSQAETGSAKIPVRRFVMPTLITSEMIRFAKTDDEFHFAKNLNAMMKHGFCRLCGLTPKGCRREGCRA